MLPVSFRDPVAVRLDDVLVRLLDHLDREPKGAVRAAYPHFKSEEILGRDVSGHALLPPPFNRREPSLFRIGDAARLLVRKRSQYPFP